VLIDAVRLFRKAFARLQNVAFKTSAALASDRVGLILTELDSSVTHIVLQDIASKALLARPSIDAALGHAFGYF
jgi:hypothetical protein